MYLQFQDILLLASRFLTSFFAGGLILVLIISAVETYAIRRDPTSPLRLPGPSLLTIVPFFTRRYDFINSGFHVTKQSIYQFNLLNNKVIVLSGKTAREVIYSSKRLDLAQGFNILSGALPMLAGVTADLQSQQIANIYKRLAIVQNSGSLSNLIPYILNDIKVIFQSYGRSGNIDPFDAIHKLTFQTSMRSLTSHDISNNPILVDRLKHLYDVLDVCTTPITVLLPWLPTSTMLRKAWATKEIFDIITDSIERRKKSKLPSDDTLQILLEAGGDRMVAVGFMMGLLVAGARSTGTTVSWLITFLAGSAEYQSRVFNEITALLTSNPFSPFPGSDSDIGTRLACIPLEKWENKTPFLDAMIRETTRVAEPHVAMRRNLGEDFDVYGKTIPKGAYVVYPFSDVHLDSNIYPDPWKFDPRRKEPEEAYSYLGWGGGKTVCRGMRLAKLQIKLIAAMFVTTYRLSLVDTTGHTLGENELPRPNWNDSLMCRPDQRSFFVHYEPRTHN